MSNYRTSTTEPVTEERVIEIVENHMEKFSDSLDRKLPSNDNVFWLKLWTRIVASVVFVITMWAAVGFYYHHVASSEALIRLKIAEVNAKAGVKPEPEEKK